MILITGCSGYIGSRLASHLLASGYTLRGLVLPAEQQKVQPLVEAGLECWPGDLLHPETLAGIEKDVTTVYHLAGLHSFSFQRTYDLYVKGTAHLLQRLVDCSELQAVIVASNMAVYGDGGDRWITEDDLSLTQHPFGHVTVAMEQLLSEAMYDHRFPSIILRIADVYGPEDIQRLHQHVPGSRIRLFGDGSNWTSRIHIADLIDILHLAPHQLRFDQIYNVCDDLPVRARDLYADLCVRYNLPEPQWQPLEHLTEKVLLSVHGLRMLSLRASNQKIKAELARAWLYPTFREGYA